jgi:dTDP-4-dehydrorhamnose reductase
MLNQCLVTGGSGMVGSVLPFGMKPSSAELDISSKQSVIRYFEEHPDISCILHLAATNLRESESDREMAVKVSVNGTLHLLQEAKIRGLPLIYVSTGAVFSSSQLVPFHENDVPSPRTFYGLTKHAGEEACRLYDKSTIVRTGWLFGHTTPAKFKIVEHFLNKLKAKDEIKACHDFWGSPTYVVDFVSQLQSFVETPRHGIFHVVNSGSPATGLDIALHLSKQLQIEGKITGTSFKDIPNCGPCRGKSEWLESDGIKLRDWKDAMSEYVERFASETQQKF